MPSSPGAVHCNVQWIGVSDAQETSVRSVMVAGGFTSEVLGVNVTDMAGWLRVFSSFKPTIAIFCVSCSAEIANP